MTDGTLYYIRDGLWSIEGEKITYIASTGEEKLGYTVETINEQYIEGRKFITEWTVGEETTITLPIYKAPNITIEWGDGTKEECTTIKPTHTYTNEGTYIIKISGKMPDWTFYNVTTSKDYITGIKQWGNTNLTSVSFNGCTNLEGTIPAPNIEEGFKNITNIQWLFSGCAKIQELEEGFTIPSGVTTMPATFSECSGLTSLPKGFTIPSGVTGMNSTFRGCSSIIRLPKGFTIPSGVTNMTGTFERCSSLTSLPEGFIIPSGVTNVKNMFYKCSSLTSLPKGFIMPNVTTNMEGMFYGCSSLTKLSEEFRIPNGVTNMRDVFAYCSSLTSLPEGFTIPSSVTNMNMTFYGTNLASLPEGFTTPESVTNMKDMLSACKKLKGEIKIEANPTEYTRCFLGTAIDSGGILTVNYTENCTNIDDIIATGNGNYIKKGTLK